MGTADERDRLLREPRAALERARRDPATWTSLSFRGQDTGEGHVRDHNQAARFGVLSALQYDRRRQDLPLLRFLLSEETAFYRQGAWGMGSDLTLAGFLVAEHRQVEDLWLHWTAKNISFDTALGYHLYHLLTGGVAAAIETVRASSHPDRDRILGKITAGCHTDAVVDEWLDQQRALFPVDPADEDLQSWADHAARLGDREASRLFITEWAAGEPRTVRIQHTPGPARATRVFRRGGGSAEGGCRDMRRLAGARVTQAAQDQDQLKLRERRKITRRFAAPDDRTACHRFHGARYRGRTPAASRGFRSAIVAAAW